MEKTTELFKLVVETISAIISDRCPFSVIEELLDEVQGSKLGLRIAVSECPVNYFVLLFSSFPILKACVVSARGDEDGL